MFYRTAQVIASLTYLLASTVSASNSSDDVECGSIEIGQLTWASSEFLSALDGLILSEGFGCDVSYVVAGPIPQITSMAEKGRPQVIPELWLNSVGAMVAEGVSSGQMVISNRAPIEGAGEGWFVPARLAEAHPEIQTLADIIERPDLFPHPDDPSLGGFHNCPVGWACHITSTNLFYAFEMDKKGWALVSTGSNAGLDASLAKAMNRDEYWIGYYWAPTTLLSEYPMEPVNFAVPFDRDMWDNCIAVEECAKPRPTDYVPSEVVTLTASEIALPNAVEVYLSERQISREQMNDMLFFMKEVQADGEEVAMEFLDRYPSYLDRWLDPAVAMRVRAAVTN